MLAFVPRSLYIRAFLMMSDDTRLKRLKFRAWRRGFREADLILGPFVDKHASTFSPAQLDSLEALLDNADQDLYEWIVEKTPAPPEAEGEMLSLLRIFRDEVYRSLGDDHGG